MSHKKRSITSALVGVLLLASQACTDASAPAGGTPAKREQAPPPEKSPSEAPTTEPAKEALPAAEDVLAKAVEAIGGKERLDTIESSHSTGRMSMPGLNIGGDIETWWKGEDFYQESMMPGVGRIRQGKKGSTMWSEDPILGLRKLEGKEAEQAEWVASISLAADWKRFFTTAKTIGVREIDGQRVYDVLLTTAAGDQVTLSFEADSGLSIGVSFDQAHPMGTMPIKIKLEDYRDVEGMKVSFRQLTDASLGTMVTELTKLELNVEVDESRFEMPSAPGAPAGAATVAPPAAGQPAAPAHTGMPFGPDGKPGRPVPPKKKQ